MRTRFGMAVVGLLLIGLAPAAAQVKLEWKFNEGDQFWLEQVQDMKMSMKIQGNNIGVDQAGKGNFGNGVAAAVMGTFGYLVSSRSVFLVTFILAFPTLLALSSIRESEIDVNRPPLALTVLRRVPVATSHRQMPPSSLAEASVLPSAASEMPAIEFS